MNGILVSAFATMVLGSQPVWHYDYSKAYREAQTENKPLLVVFENSSDPQQRFQQVSATKTESSQQLLSNYVLCRLDVSTEYGQYWAERFRTTSVPYAVITDKAMGRIVFRKAGRFSGTDWETTLTTYKNGQVQQANYSTNYNNYSRQFYNNAASYYSGGFGGGFGFGGGGGC